MPKSSTGVLSRIAGRTVTQTSRKARLVKVMADAKIIRPVNPIRLADAAVVLARRGTGFGGGIAAQAKLNPNKVCIIDELGPLTWSEIDARATQLANSLAERGVEERDSVAVMCRNSRYFLEVSTALGKIGADIVYLNTAFAAPQLAEVCEREDPRYVVFDQEFTDLITRSGMQQPQILAFVDDASAATDALTCEKLIHEGSTEELPVPVHQSRPIILTSGTTGTPKGAPRAETGLDSASALLDRIPFKRGGVTHIAAPLFHTWAWAQLNLAMLLESTVVLTRTFDPESCLELVREHQCDTLIAIPVMLQRILKLPEAARSGDWSHLKIVACSGSSLPGDLSTEWMDAFGDNLYNTYGATEVAWATIAQPSEMRARPGTCGKTPYNTVVQLLDSEGEPVLTGEPGRVFVGNSMLFGGYTGNGGHKEVINGLMASGDIGRFDTSGLLFIEGRDDEMIVSGGENVFPQEIENTLSRHPGIVEAAAIGVSDADFGQRLRAFVVRDPHHGADLTEGQLKGYIKENLARFKVPREIVFLEELPRNATGKILKRELDHE